MALVPSTYVRSLTLELPRGVHVTITVVEALLPHRQHPLHPIRLHHRVQVSNFYLLHTVPSTCFRTATKLVPLLSGIA